MCELVFARPHTHTHADTQMHTHTSRVCVRERVVHTSRVCVRERVSARERVFVCSRAREKRRESACMCACVFAFVYERTLVHICTHLELVEGKSRKTDLGPAKSKEWTMSKETYNEPQKRTTMNLKREVQWKSEEIRNESWKRHTNLTNQQTENQDPWKKPIKRDLLKRPFKKSCVKETCWGFTKGLSEGKKPKINLQSYHQDKLKRPIKRNMFEGPAQKTCLLHKY